MLADVHACILKDDPLALAHLCQEDVDLDERFSPEINDQHVGMTPLSLACALNKVQLARVGSSLHDFLKFNFSGQPVYLWKYPFKCWYMYTGIACYLTTLTVTVCSYY